MNKTYSITKQYTSNPVNNDVEPQRSFNFHQNTKSKLSSLLKPTSSLNKYSSFSTRSNAGEESILEKLKRPNSFLMPSGNNSFLKSRSKMNNVSLNHVSEIVKSYTGGNAGKYSSNRSFTKNLTLKTAGLLNNNNAFRK